MGTSFKLQNGLLLLSTEAPGGVYNGDQLKAVAALCDGEDAVVKATEDQRLALFVPPAKAAKVAAQLKAVGLGVRHYQDGLHQPINCLGALCGEHLQDAMGSSMDLAEELQGIVLDQPLKIGINGCARCCLATHTLDISIIGDSGGYRVSLGGKNSQLPEMASFMAEGVPAAKLPKLIAKVVSVYKELSQPGESLQEVMERAGTQRFIATLAPYSQDAAESGPFAEEAPAAAPKAAGGPDLKIDDLSADEAFDEPTIDSELGSESLGAEPSFDDSDLELMDDGGGAEAASAAGDLDSLESEEIAALPEARGEDEALEEETLSAAAGSHASAPATEDTIDNPDAIDTLDPIDDEAAFAVDDLAVGDDLLEESLGADAPAAAEAPSDDLDLTPELVEDDALLEDSLGDDLEEESLAAAPKPAAKPAAAAPTLKAVANDEDLEGELDADDMAAADEIPEAEADAFEEKLNASIAEESALLEVEDDNSSARLEAVELVNAASNAPSADEDDLALAEATEPLADEISSDELALADELAVGELALDDDLAVDSDDDAGAPPAAEAPVVPAPSPVKQVTKMAKEAPRGVATAKGFEFTGLDINAEGRISLQFASGAALELDPAALMANGRRELKLAGKVVSLVPRTGGLNVEVDGVSIFVPQGQAAA